MKLESQRWRTFADLQDAVVPENSGPLADTIVAGLYGYQPDALPLEVVVWIGRTMVMALAIDYEEAHPKPLVVHRWHWLRSGEVVRGIPSVWFMDKHGKPERCDFAESWDVANHN